MDRNDHKWFLNKVLQAIRTYGLIEKNDHIAVGVSGGKDSQALLFILNELRQYRSFSFTLSALHIDMGFSDYLPASLEEFCANAKIPFKSINTSLSQNIISQKNPCLYCSTMRRGILVRAAQEIGAQKIALAHQRNDFVETLLLNLFNGGRFQVFTPRLDYPEQGLSIIRPLVYLDSQTTNGICRKYHLPIWDNPCPFSQSSRREAIRQLIIQIEQTEPQFCQKILHALESLSADDLWQTLHPVLKSRH